MKTDAAYELLREFASPVIAVTSAWRGQLNGMISDSGMRASISPHVPRLSLYVHKWHLTHDRIWSSGRFGIHLLHRGQLDLVHTLGFESGRTRDKLANVPHFLGQLGLPILADRVVGFELRVINTMDAGHSTLFLGHIEAVHPGATAEILTAPWLRTHLPPEWQAQFLANYRKAQEQIEAHPDIEDRHWPGPVA